ncbi:type I polyketide synthase [Xenococcus sp. PCC 7305]|uniref:hybrid fatty acyl-AMP ligase/type I polyketide synthase n=1 Tax=Xenococcus sp. PCC 7305 TaxID=102125 RepID=UPI0002F9FC17|nr:type I polyketide synthase [Xenococcus sp. PCC 7305]
MDKYQTFIDRLAERVASRPEKTAFTFLQDGETESSSLSYQELEAKATAIATVLQSRNAKGERALLLYQPGLEFITAFLGCLYAGVVAVPAYPPRANRSIGRLLAIVADANAKFALTSEDLRPKIEEKFHLAGQKSLHFIATDQIEVNLADHWRRPELTSQNLAFLQYTSGSTGTPKGVMVSHRNLLDNSSSIQQAFQNLPEQKIVSWLPPYHDMGLIGSILQPLYVGSSMYMMPPVTFLQRPYRWLKVIDKYRAETSGGPNFAYDLCVSQISEEQRDSLDLSCWTLAFSGAEPVRAETIQRFSSYFQSSGFRKQAFYPCYGMAESTLLITGGERQVEPILRNFDKQSIEQNHAIAILPTSSVPIGGEPMPTPILGSKQAELITLVSCGTNRQNQCLAIANTDNLEECSEGEVGEIWAASNSIGQGYWNRPELTQYAFGARLENYPNVRFLRTGDLGFIQDGELFVTGRLKDLIIIRGRNHYPQDIELTVDNAQVAVRPGNGAAFSVEIDGEEKLVITQEIKRTYLRKLNVEEVTKAIRQAVLQNHELNPHAIVLIKTASIPKTSSGKIQRHACKAAFLDGSLNVVGKSVSSDQLKNRDKKIQNRERQGNNQQEIIEDWLIENIAQRLAVSNTEVDSSEPFASLGLDSVQAVRLSADLEDYLQLKLSPTLVYDYPNISSLASYLSHLNSTLGEGQQRSQQTKPKTSQTEIAIIGMGCRFPGANNPQEFWTLLQNGQEAIKKSDRWSGEDYGGFISDVDKFDPQFFGITPRETQRMDPQQRLLLEVSWEALEDAAIAPEAISDTSTGVFVGISSSDYSQLQLHYGTELDAYAGTGNAHSIAANRLSYSLDLRGPSMSVDTACSSSLVAVHLACQSLKNGECQTAIAGGVNLMLSPELTQTFSLAGMMAADGRCKTFDAEADGYVRGEGCGVIILKRLDDAIRDRDNVLAVVKGSAINQDGRSNGLTAPNGLAQQEVIHQAIANAGVTAQDISHIEAHGTGTRLGDPIEVSSLKAVFAGQSENSISPENTSCYLSSVKTNIGHLEAAAGIAGLIKTVLSLQNEAVPPHRNFKNLNPLIDLADTSLSIPTTLQSWPPSAKPRLAGISSFGFGGTNAHVIIQDSPFKVKNQLKVKSQEIEERPCHILTLSAKNETALSDVVAKYQKYLQSNPDVEVANLCFTANTGRSHFNHRLAIPAASSVELQEKLTDYLSGKSSSGLVSSSIEKSQKNKLAFLFTGQGSQYEGMGRELYQTQPIFRSTLDHCARILQPYLGDNLINIIYPHGSADNGTSSLNQTKYTQPAIFALEYSLAQMWLSWGIKPDLLMGHSVGEYVAAAIAGVFSLEDGLKLIAERGALMQALPQNGGMVVVFAEAEVIKKIIKPYQETIAIAAINGTQNIVISGDNDGLEQVVGKLDAQGITYKQLTVSHAFHSPLMQPILSDFTQVAQTINYQEPQINLISNVTGNLVTQEIASPEYWVNHVIAPVKFAQGMASLQKQACNVFLEVGSKPILLGMGRSILENIESTNTGVKDTSLYLPSLRPRKSDWSQIIKSLASLYIQGVKIDWQGFEQGYVREKLQLPTYPFQRQSYWLEKNEQVAAVNYAKVLAGKVESPGTTKLGYYQVEWREYLQAGDPKEFSAGQWIIFGDADNLGAEIAQQLKSFNQDYLLVSEKGNLQAENNIDIDYNSYPDFQKVITKQAKIQGILYLWSLDGLNGSELDTKDIEQYQQRNCTSILNLVQTLFKQSVVAPIWIITRDSQFIETKTGSLSSPDANSIVGNSLWGLGKVIASEHPEYYGGIIDLNREKQTTEANTVLGIINHSLQEDYFSIRQEKIYVPRLVKAKSLGKKLSAISANGSYLITGGLGALGLQAAQWLASRGAKNLVLIGRSRPNEKAQQVITELENNGVTIEVVPADITNSEAIANVIETYRANSLRGVIHAAGVLDDGILQNQTWEKFHQVLAPKVIGAWNLHQCTKDLDLDFFVMFSSVASLVGSPGQGNYAAANASLDAIANYRQSIGLPALSINWGAWANSGMAVSQGFNRQGLELIDPQQGLDALAELLNANAAQVGVMSVDWDELSKQFPYLKQANYFSELLATTETTEESKTGDVYQQLLGLNPEAREDYLREYLHNAIANILQLQPDNLSLSESLFDLGMDSLMLMEAINQLKEDLQLMLYPREFYERPRIDSLAKYLATEFSNSVNAHQKCDPADASSAKRRALPEGSSIISEQLLVANEQFTSNIEQFSAPHPSSLIPHPLKAPIAFILSSPRSGSTLLRVMLAGHPDIASPPELHLLPFATMAARQAELESSYLGEGLQRAFMELQGIDAEASETLVSDLVRDDIAVPEVYQMLQELAGDRLLIDKSPTYASNRAILNQAEAVFSNAKYIHLVRHPYAVIESFARMRMDKLIGEGNSNAYQLAESVWNQSNHNILDFAQQIDSDKLLLVHYEELVASPEKVMREICNFLDLPFHPGVLTPYEGNRMTDGVSDKSMSIGDPNFLKRKQIDPKMADAWREIKLPLLLNDFTQDISARLDYELTQELTAEDNIPLSELDHKMEEILVNIRGLRVCLCTWGPKEGPIVVCLHGILDQGAAWSEVAIRLAQKGYRVVAPDLRGHGKSDRVGKGGSYNLMDFLGDVDAIVEALAGKAFTLVGHSLGSVVAAIFASVRPQLVKNLVLIETILPTDAAEEDAAEQLATHLDYLASPPQHPIFPDVEAAAERLRQATPGLSKAIAMMLAERITEPYGDGVRWRWEPLLRTRAGIGFNGIGRSRYLGLLKRIKAPITLVYGDKSSFNRNEDLTEQQAAMPNAKRVVLSGGHNLPLEEPNGIAKIISSAIALTSKLIP